jgi:putative endopeptidase
MKNTGHLILRQIVQIARLAVLLYCATLVGEGVYATQTLPVGATDKPRVHAEIGTFGVDLSTRKPSVKPGDDFYEYANGSWIDSFAIPADRGGYGLSTKLSELSEQRLRDIIENASQGTVPTGSNRQKIADYYASFMDQQAIDARGLDPIAPDLDRIAAARSRTAIAALFGSPGYSSVFAVSTGADPKSPGRYALNIVQAGLGLPDRDYYLNNDKGLQVVRQKYLEHIAHMLDLAHIEHGQLKAQAILRFETALAHVQWSIEKRRDPHAIYNPRSKQELVAYAPGFAWQAFLDASEIGDRPRFILNELTAIRDGAKVFEQTPLNTLKAYLTYHFLSDHARVLPRAFDSENFAFYGTVLNGTPEQRARWTRGVRAVNAALGDAVGEMYVARYFPPESKAKMENLVGNLRVAFTKRIDRVSWMTPETKRRAQEKLAKFVQKIGYPDKWKDYSALNIVRGDAIGNQKRAVLWEWHRQLARLDGPVDRGEWGMQVSDINAYYNPLNNEIVFPAAILQPPFFDANADDAVNYGGIGTVIGHEISHGFDDEGRMFAADGSLTNWWTQQDASAFTDRSKKLAAVYSSFEALPGLFVRGGNTLGENIGDLGGVNIALDAYHYSLHGASDPVIGEFTGDQRFFLSFAQIWRAKYRDNTFRNIVMTDVHSPANFRVDGTLPNIDAWYEAFGVQPGDKMYRTPSDRVRIW